MKPENLHTKMKNVKETSKVSAILIKPYLKNLQYQILETLSVIKKGTFREIAQAAGLEPDQVWKRMSELEKKGFVIGNEITMCQKTNRPVTLWKLKETLFD